MADYFESYPPSSSLSSWVGWCVRFLCSVAAGVLRYAFDKRAEHFQSRGVRNVKLLEDISEMSGAGTGGASSGGSGGELVAVSEGLSRGAMAPSSAGHGGQEGKKAAPPTTRVKHVDHLCDATVCELPKENFWKK